jgi:dihydrofolate reductase
MVEKIVIAALGSGNRVIGDRGKLPWSIPEDVRRFRQLTLNHTVIMGRKTWELDLEQSPLPQRLNIVVSQKTTLAQDLSRQGSWHTSEDARVLFVPSLQAALKCCIQEQPQESQVFIMGGAMLYAEALPLADRLELTIVLGNHPGDTFFPAYEPLIGSIFQLRCIEIHAGYRYETYDRKPV